MKKLLVSVFLVFCFITPTQKAHALDPKAKAFMVMTSYGTIGGALLGFASLAFGTNSRAIAQGASLGLYAGIIFGAYVIQSHNTSMQPQDEYQEPYDPYAPPQDQGGYAPQGYGNPPPQQPQGGGGYGAPVPQEESGGFFGNRAEEINFKVQRNFQPIGSHGKSLSRVPIYINFYNSTF